MTLEPVLIDDPSPAENVPPPASDTTHETVTLARNASVIALGNVISRVLGLVRDTVKSHFFGAGVAVDAFNIATLVPTMLNDLLIGGLLDSALVPVFSEYAEKRRDELWQIASILLSLTLLALSLITVLIAVFSPLVAALLNNSPDPESILLTARLMRLTTPAVIFLSLGGIMAALLYALKRFTYPAFMAAIFNLGIVVITLGFQARLSITAMALGWLIGSVAQVLLMLPGLRDARFRPSLMLRHPALRQIVALYLPILGGLVVEMIIRTVSYRLATETGVGGVSWMQYATTLRQLPQGLVGNAVSFAILPTLAALAVRSRDGGDVEPYRAALARGLKLVIVLIIPATVGLMILGRPTVDLLFEHGSFTPHDTLMTTLALYFYLFGLPFAAIDLLLVFSFYARQDTLTPALIGVGTNIAYLIVMLLLLRPLGLFSLMVADSFKQLLHAAVSAYILRRHVGGLAGHNVLRTAAITLLGAGVMAFVTWLTLRGIDSLFSVESGLADVLDVLVPGAVGGVAYLGLVSALRVEEITLLFDALRRRFLPS